MSLQYDVTKMYHWQPPLRVQQAGSNSLTLWKVWSLGSTKSMGDLTHCGLIMSYGIRELGQQWFRKWLVAWRHQAITWINVDLLWMRFRPGMQGYVYLNSDNLNTEVVFEMYTLENNGTPPRGHSVGCVGRIIQGTVYPINHAHILKTIDHQFDNIVVTCSTVSCHYDNLQCHKWRQNCQIDNLLFSVWFCCALFCCSSITSWEHIHVMYSHVFLFHWHWHQWNKLWP